MRISGDMSRIMGVYNKDQKINKIDKASTTESKKDTMILSSQAKEYQIAMKAIQQIPDIRKEKVQALQGEYESGNYNISGEDIADKIVQKFIDKKI